jgi:hypothetical protein
MYARPDAVAPSSWIVPGCVVCAKQSKRTCSRSTPARISSRLTASALMWGIRTTPSSANSDAKALVVAHHHRVGELAAQRLDLGAISDVLKVVHRVVPLFCCGLRGPRRRLAGEA